MPKPAADELYKEGQTIVVKGRAALITGIGDGSVGYNFINGDGTLGESGHFHEWEKDVKHIDFAKVSTLVKLPPEWEERAIEYDKARPKSKKVATDDWEPEEHPSYGTVHISRCSGHASLFMSPFRHMHFMTLSIRRATKHRSLANDRTYSHRELVGIALSEAQWARLVASAGIGEGTPCTISHVAGAMMPECPEQVEVEKFHEDTQRYMKKSAECLDESIEAIKALLDKPSVSKAERKALLDKLTSARDALTGGVPFVASQIRERMEHIVSEGKTEIETFFQRTVQRLGLKQLQETPPVEFQPALPPKKEEP